MHGFDLIVLDCAYQIMGGLDENANGQMTELGRFFSELQKGNTTLVVVHHFVRASLTQSRYGIDLEERLRLEHCSMLASS